MVFRATMTDMLPLHLVGMFNGCRSLTKVTRPNFRLPRLPGLIEQFLESFIRKPGVRSPFPKSADPHRTVSSVRPFHAGNTKLDRLGRDQHNHTRFGFLNNLNAIPRASHFGGDKERNHTKCDIGKGPFIVVEFGIEISIHE